MEKINKRLIGKEDIAFDYDGNNNKDSYQTSEGNIINLKKINAGDLPITIEARQKIAGAENVDQAICIIADSLGDNIAGSKLTEDTTVVFSKNDTQKTMQDKINAALKDLGWHTLTFKFPIEVEHILPSSLIFEGFYHGNIVITSEDNGKATVKDQTGCDALFLIRNCTANWKITNLELKHDYCMDAVNVFNSASGSIDGCSFVGHGSFALCLNNSFGYITNSTYSNETRYRMLGFFGSGVSLAATGAKIGVASEQDFYFSNLLTYDGAGKLMTVVQTAMYKNTTEPALRFYCHRSDGSQGEKIILYSDYVDLPATVRLSSGIIKSKSATERLAVYGGTTSKDGAYLSLRGNANTAGTAGEFILATSEVNGNAKLLRGKPDGALTWLDKDITLGYPNYAAGVDKTSSYIAGTGWTATQDGWVFMRTPVGASGSCSIYCNGGLLRTSTEDVTASAFFPVKKGDVITIRPYKTPSTVNATATPQNLIFYPNR
jgi:hypothetical protein